MARIIKNDPNHSIAIKGDHGGEVCVVKGGKRLAYLWVSPSRGDVVTISGEKTLRKLAKSILAEVGMS